MTIVQLQTKHQTCEISVGCNAETAFQKTGNSRVIIITDTNVLSLYPTLFSDREVIVVNAGEQSKDIHVIAGIYEKLQEMEADKTVFLIGIGGGVVCDIAGYVASTWLRGVRFGFVPTTVLAQADAAIGGKNGINLGKQKNAIGIINQPEFVICDISFFNTLPEKEVINGLAECIKIALIADAEYFAFFEIKKKEILQRKSMEIEHCILRAIQIKAKYVEKDEREQNIRRELNFGHTFGHSIETGEKVPHGFAVSIGMAMAVAMSNKYGAITQNEMEKIFNLLQFFGLPIKSAISQSVLLSSLKTDKKRKGDVMYFVLLNGIGKAFVKGLSYHEISILSNDLQ